MKYSTQQYKKSINLDLTNLMRESNESILKNKSLNILKRLNDRKNGFEYRIMFKTSKLIIKDTITIQSETIDFGNMNELYLRLIYAYINIQYKDELIDELKREPILLLNLFQNDDKLLQYFGYIIDLKMRWIINQLKDEEIKEIIVQTLSKKFIAPYSYKIETELLNYLPTSKITENRYDVKTGLNSLEKEKLNQINDRLNINLDLTELFLF